MAELNKSLYENFSTSISYPTAELFLKSVSDCNELLKENGSRGAVSGFKKFKAELEKLDETQLEELYTKTFDINGVCSLDLGYVLFGEDYKRGALLVEISRLLRENDVDPGTELADHLPNVLRLLPKLTNFEEREQMIEKLVIPAINNMILKFGKGNNKKCIYYYALKSLRDLLEDSLEEFNL
ncbi:MAG: hypothetical protein HON90_01875 [Halobacteriovoraceae bacterium]|nr:hypothetical protein [Halobacteriovoraceae bacterium]